MKGKRNKCACKSMSCATVICSTYQQNYILMDSGTVMSFSILSTVDRKRNARTDSFSNHFQQAATNCKKSLVNLSIMHCENGS